MNTHDPTAVNDHSDLSQSDEQPCSSSGAARLARTGDSPQFAAIIANVETQLGELRRAQGEHDKFMSFLNERDKQLDEQAKDLEWLQRTLYERDEAVEKHEREIEEREQAIEQIRQSLNEQVAQSAHALEESQGQLRDASQRLEQANNELAQIRSELEHAKCEVEESRQKLEVAGREHDRLREAMENDEQERVRLQSELARAHEAAQESTQELAELRSELEQRSQSLEHASCETASMQSNLVTVQRQLEEAHGRLAESSADAEALQGAARQLKQREQSINELTQRLRDTESQVKAAKDQVILSTGASFASLDVGLRKHRLVRYKELLRDQSSKLLQAKEILQKRRIECETILRRRKTLAEVQQTLTQRSSMLDSRMAKTKAGAWAMFLTIALAILAALSWSVAQRVAPSTYLLESTLKAQAEGQTLGPKELDAWRTYITELAHDPRLVEVAADRMKRRGLLDLATPADLGDRMESDLDVASRGADSMSMTLRGKGAERTKRTLDTYIATVVAVANEARDRRLDHATTILASAADPSPRPIDQPFLLYAALIWLTTSVALGLGFVLLWRRLANSMQGFERQAAVEQILDAGSWPAPTAE